MGTKKSLSVRVQERAQRVLPAARNRAQVVALQHAIEQAMKDGCTLAMIWNTLHEEGTIVFGYETFRAHVRKLIRPHPEARPAFPPTTMATRPLKKIAKPASSGTDPERGFVFSPTPNDEELF